MRRAFGIAIASFLLGAGLPATNAAQEEPDLILHDGIVLTLDPDHTVATAVAVAGWAIAAVGSESDILALAGPSTTVVDLDGLAVLPGFIDSHAHWIGDRDLYGVSSAQEAIQMALEGGWTSLNELFVNQQRLDELIALDAAGELRVRVNAYLPVNYGPDQRFGMWFSAYTPGEQLGPRLRLAGVKFFIDACGPDTMYLSEPRENGDRGRFHWRRRELRRLVRRVHEAGWQIAAHACGDGAVDEIVDALARAFDGERGRPSRARIEHLIALRDDQIKRLRRLGILPSFQLTFVDSAWAEDYRSFPRDRRDLLGRWRDLASDPRLHAIGSTDSPYGEGADLQPTSVMEALVQATTRIGEPGDRAPRWMRKQRLTLMQALHLLTGGGAYGVFAEDELGAIAPGMLADLVVLSEDPREVPRVELERITVAMVFVGGALEVCAAGYEAVCPLPAGPAMRSWWPRNRASERPAPSDRPSAALVLGRP
ncbi:MAG TPA: amidohydrolase family protein [Actinomycetota bacterium]|nr:amidohydrolase family protein [Actinomycetota bacterium]